MDRFNTGLNRRRFLTGAGLATLSLTSSSALAKEFADLSPPGDTSFRAFATAFPGKGPMILQRTRPPLLETPFNVFDKSIITPNDQFYVRWHWANIPTKIDADAFRLNVRGQVNLNLSLSLQDLAAMPSVDLVAVNQCSGNSRGFFQPRVPGAQWSNGSMGNARWTGVRLKDVLDRAGVKAGAVAVRFNGLDQPVMPDGPDFMKSLAIDHARDGEVMIAYQMNGEQLPLLNGFPLRLVVPGWYATYWVKMLNDIEVLDKPDDNYWTAKAYLIPDTPMASIKPGETGVKMVPINRMVPRSFFTNMPSGDSVAADTPVSLRGIAFGGDAGVKSTDLSLDGGMTWLPAQLGKDEGKYSFRRWEASLNLPRGRHNVLVRCTNSNGDMQPLAASWNPSGFMRNPIETVGLFATHGDR
ncbi:molybdopterin-dependent oxidoreductase [Methyloferula stellata]|uniref:molybdopterin-dependent oxidoreductase n=1 Tax=Methyloferula stellata TaxID=876270 RepID=UPI00036C72F9|nr:molybdopterin-dependent oxidoreductase [Methyloferula stellata]